MSPKIYFYEASSLFDVSPLWTIYWNTLYSGLHMNVINWVFGLHLLYNRLLFLFEAYVLVPSLYRICVKQLLKDNLFINFTAFYQKPPPYTLSFWNLLTASIGLLVFINYFSEDTICITVLLYKWFGLQQNTGSTLCLRWSWKVSGKQSLEGKIQ